MPARTDGAFPAYGLVAVARVPAVAVPGARRVDGDIPAADHRRDADHRLRGAGRAGAVASATPASRMKAPCLTPGGQVRIVNGEEDQSRPRAVFRRRAYRAQDHSRIPKARIPDCIQSIFQS